MTDEIQKAIDISNLTDEQIFELYSDVVEWGEGDLLANCYATCREYCQSPTTAKYLRTTYIATHADAYGNFTSYRFQSESTGGTYCYTYCVKN